MHTFFRLLDFGTIHPEFSWILWPSKKGSRFFSHGFCGWIRNSGLGIRENMWWIEIGDNILAPFILNFHEFFGHQRKGLGVLVGVCG